MMKSTLAVVAAIAAVVAGMPAAHAARAYAVTVAASTTSITLGEASTFSGTVSPSVKGGKMTIETKKKGKWSKVGDFSLSKTSTYSYDVRPGSAGVREFRICKSATKTITKGCSSAVTLNVYRWHYLTDQDYVTSDDLSAVDVSMINGTAYKKSLRDRYAYGSAYREYNLYRKCTELTATVGLDDDVTQTGGQRQIEILTDGTSKFLKTYSLGQSEAITVPTANALRIRFETTPINTDAYAFASFGSPKVKCLF